METTPPIQFPPRKRIHHWDNPGDAHFLTFSCYQRRPFLSSDRSRQWMIDAVQRARSNHGFDLWAYVIMPEHVHLLILPHSCLISELLNSIKQSVSKRAIAWVEQEAKWFLPEMIEQRPGGKITRRFWQPGPGYDRNMRSTADVWEKIDYSHYNPVKRKLCVKANDWKWSSAADYAGVGAGLLPLDLGMLPRRPARKQ